MLRNTSKKEKKKGKRRAILGELHAKSTENSFFARPGDASKFIAVLANFSSFEEEL